MMCRPIFLDARAIQASATTTICGVSVLWQSDSGPNQEYLSLQHSVGAAVALLPPLAVADELTFNACGWL
jgi:hypothetical protein